MPKPRKTAIAPQGEGWRAELAKKKAMWANRNLDEVHQAIEDDVYERSLRGERLAPIARWYGVAHVEFESVYGEIWQLGYGKNQNDSIVDMIETGRRSGMPVMKMMGHKTALGIENLATTISDVPKEDKDSGFQINVNVIRKGDGSFDTDVE